MTGLFSPSSLRSFGGAGIPLPHCGRCGLYKSCRSPKMPMTGEGRRKILVIAEAPGADEDEANTQLVGQVGRFLRKHLKEIGVKLDRDCWKTNAVICRPEGNAKPTKDQILACRSNTLKTIRETKPTTIILMGGAAIESVIGWLWKEAVGATSRWVGWKIPSQKLNAWVCPVFHPSYIMRKENEQSTGKVATLWWKQHLKEAFELEGRPWKEVPNYEKDVRVLLDGSMEEKIQWFINDGSPVAFDYECNMLKPDGDKAEIVCASMSNGKLTIAFPMHGPAVQAFREFLKSPLLKIAQNMKFEDRWSRAILKTTPRNWSWDTMQASHILDNRRGVTGLKFQVFVSLGQGSYDDTVEPFLKAPSSNEKNRIRQADVRDVLLYCGMDALCTWHLAKKQRRIMNGDSEDSKNHSRRR